jgi:2',5'-phosphodiesterase
VENEKQKLYLTYHFSYQMCFRHVQDLATRQNVPCIVAGDFNIKPADSSYKFLTTGQLDSADPCYPASKNGDEWTPSCQPMDSASVAYLSKEPDFTNYARVKEDDPFIDTLDYIFLSQGQWKVKNMTLFVDREQAGGPFPNLDVSEPSDHILMAADLVCLQRSSAK